VSWGLEHISSLELSEWMAYDQVEPFGELRADLRAGIITATIANVNRDADKHREPFTPQDFMPNFDQVESKPQGMTPEETLAMVRAWMPPPDTEETE
jgi:hypothetical protein